jgi:PLP dependent protein
MNIKNNLEGLLKEIPAHVKLVAVSKTMPPPAVMEAYEAGHRMFGENKAQEMISKQSGLPKDIKWHFIGHLQRNKVKQIVPFVDIIHSVDSFRLLNEISKEAIKISRVIDCLLQFHIATEESKFGFDREEAVKMVDADSFQSLANIRICGVMGMATWTGKFDLVRKEFKGLVGIFNQLKSGYFNNNPDFKEISMGMSGDYKIAIEVGSTIIRVGSAIFGERYHSA